MTTAKPLARRSTPLSFSHLQRLYDSCITPLTCHPLCSRRYSTCPFFFDQLAQTGSHTFEPSASETPVVACRRRFDERAFSLLGPLSSPSSPSHRPRKHSHSPNHRSICTSTRTSTSTSTLGLAYQRVVVPTTALSARPKPCYSSDELHLHTSTAQFLPTRQHQHAFLYGPRCTYRSTIEQVHPQLTKSSTGS